MAVSTVGCTWPHRNSECRSTLHRLQLEDATKFAIQFEIYQLTFLCGVVETVPPIVTHVTVAWSVCLFVCPFVCRLSHSCTPLKPLDGMRCHLAGTLLVVPSNIVLDRGAGPPRKEEIGSGTHSSQRYRLLTNYFSRCCDFLLAEVQMWIVRRPL